MRALEQQESALSFREAGDKLRKRYEGERKQIIQQCGNKIAAILSIQEKRYRPQLPFSMV
jgi:hypothetical protein